MREYCVRSREIQGWGPKLTEKTKNLEHLGPLPKNLSVYCSILAN